MAGTSVFVIDDEPNIQKFFSEALARYGYSVRGALDGEDGIEQLKLSRPEVVFLDLKLPGADGVQVLRKIRAQYSDIPVIIITGYPRDEMVEEALGLGILACLVKPFGLLDVLAILDALGLPQAV